MALPRHRKHRPTDRPSKPAGETAVRQKHLKVKPHHNKLYRKRHLALLIVASCGVVGLTLYILQYNLAFNSGVKSVRNFLASYLQTSTPSTSNGQFQTVNSTYGFSVTYDQQKFYASAIDSASESLYVASELHVNRAYEEVKLSGSAIPTGQNNATSMNIRYYYHQAAVAGVSDGYAGLENSLVGPESNPGGQPYTVRNSSDVSLSGVKFRRSVWIRSVQSSLLSMVTVSFVSYTGVVHGHPMVILANGGLSNNDAGNLNNDLQAIISSLQFTPPATAEGLLPTTTPSVREQQALSLLDRFTLTGMASAATPDQTVNAAQKVTALYGPAVVKVYNVFCMDIYLLGRPYIHDACQAVTGSAFFVGQDGYLGTNGHVATSSPKDIVIYDALVALSQKGDASQLDTLGAVAKININTPIFTGKTIQQKLAIIVDQLYNIDDSEIVQKNSAINLLVDLNQGQPDLTELLTDTQARKTYPDQNNIKHARLQASDYRMIDGIDGFRASDMAILKLDGSDYPVVKIGSINNITPGSDLNILGYPASATNNGIVDNTKSILTLTTGKASAVKNAEGSPKKLIETSTTIGHGNSGGPVLDDNGSVVGIATYTVDGSGAGNGTYNYVRDIKDLVDLASKSSIPIDANSPTQSAWEKAMNYFYISHFSKALPYFNQVKQLYPQHPTVDALISEATQNIKDGKDVKDFPVLPVVIGAVVFIVAVGVAVFLIIRHKKVHQIFQLQVAAGVTTPASPGTSQTISYNPAQYTMTGKARSPTMPVSVAGAPPAVPSVGATMPTPTVMAPQANAGSEYTNPPDNK